ncbi:MAG: Nif3-like dinuclear metal center hexameric protein [Deltaproteobacteria bacterium]|nr:Nif3-like dinuclear metal center hexameric protein [Deltaproteobacteria bacterium]
MVKTKDILELVNAIASFDIAEDWDNSGLQAGNPDWEVKKIMIGLDVSMALMTAAEEWNSDLVLTHHPLMIRPENSMDFSKMPGSAIETAARQKISIVSAHTNLDKAKDGLNDYFAAKIGLKKTKRFFCSTSSSLLPDEITGIGRLGQLESSMTLKQVADKIKERLKLPYLRVTGNMDLSVKSIAICTGSGGSLIDEFLKSGAGVYVTGDIKYHEARLVEEHSKGLIDVGHFGSEHMAVDLLSDKLGQVIKKAGLNIQIKKFKKEKDPFLIV